MRVTLNFDTAEGTLGRLKAGKTYDVPDALGSHWLRNGIADDAVDGEPVSAKERDPDPVARAQRGITRADAAARTAEK